MLKDFINRLKFKFRYPTVIVDNSLDLRVIELERRVKNIEATLDIVTTSNIKIDPPTEEQIRQTVEIADIHNKLSQFHQGYKTLGQKVREYERKSLESAREKGLVK